MFRSSLGLLQQHAGLHCNFNHFSLDIADFVNIPAAMQWRVSQQPIVQSIALRRQHFKGLQILKNRSASVFLVKTLIFVLQEITKMEIIATRHFLI